MKLLGEKIYIVDKKKASVIFAVVLSTFLLLFLYHKDVWRPIQYWLFLNGCILFVVPLLSLAFLGEKKNAAIQIIAGSLMVLIISFLFIVGAQSALFSKMKQLSIVIPLSGSILIVTVLVLSLGKIDVREFGMRLGKVKFWVPVTIIFFVCMVPIIYWASTMPEFQKTYPMLPLARKGIAGFIVAELSFGLFFIFWEYFFRGYMLFVLEKKTGFLIANLIQAMAFAFMHLGKPELEVYSSLVGGLIIGWLCYRSRTFFPAFLIHWGIQTTMDLFAVLP